MLIDLWEATFENRDRPTRIIADSPEKALEVLRGTIAWRGQARNPFVGLTRLGSAHIAQSVKAQSPPAPELTYTIWTASWL